MVQSVYLRPFEFLCTMEKLLYPLELSFVL